MPVFSFTAPHITPDEELQERKNLTEEEKAELERDLYGGDNDDRVKETEETQDFLQQKLDEMGEELANMPAHQTKDYRTAQQQCPELVETESDPIKFLRCEDYNASAAAKRLQLYWKMRRKCFGDDRAYLPMTMSGAMQQDIGVIESGIFGILPSDLHGRGVLFFDRIKAIPPLADRDAALRCMFYMIHVMSEYVPAQKHGLLCLSNIKNYDLYKHFDRIFIKQSSVLMVECMPTKTKAYHLLSGSENGVMSLVLPVMKHVVAKELRLRMVVHSGTDAKIMESLKPYGLCSANVGSVVGGDFSHSNFLSWLDSWRDIEEGDITQSSEM